MFADRGDAGRRLAVLLTDLPRARLVVLGLPRGGVPVAAEIARALGAPLDVILVRKLGVPVQPELAMGAIGEGGVRVLNDGVLRLAGVSQAEVDDAQAREERELERQAQRFRGARPRRSLAGSTALIVDDGIATGATVRAACQVARANGATRVVVAAPVAPPDTIAFLHADADEVIALEMPRRLGAIGQFYEDFTPPSDDEVVRLLSI